MMKFENYSKIVLQPGELIVAATAFRDYVLVITDRGTVYKITDDGSRT
jgi:hypothetical protein